MVVWKCAGCGHQAEASPVPMNGTVTCPRCGHVASSPASGSGSSNHGNENDETLFAIPSAQVSSFKIGRAHV